MIVHNLGLWNNTESLRKNVGNTICLIYMNRPCLLSGSTIIDTMLKNT